MDFDVNLVDTHCHIDFIFKRIYQNNPHDELRTFRDLRMKYLDDFPYNFYGCVAVFCDPKNWLTVLIIRTYIFT